MRTVKRRPVLDSYLKLVQEFPLRRLKNGAENEEATRMYLRVSSGKQNAGTQEYLEVLADLMGEYEQRAGFGMELPDVTAAELIEHRLAERGMSVAALAKEVGIPQPNLSAMLAGKRDWSKAAIRSLSAFFHIRAERFLQ
jgi:antitoxin component HigA of HigAB toxin-antitoxin module